jgi:hypothetical protein
MENTICPQCGGPVEQSGRGRPRRFCSKQCGIDFYNDAKPRKYRDQDGFNATRHMLSNINPEAGTGDCSKCGPGIRVWDVGGTKTVRWRCANRAKLQPSRRRYKEGRGREAGWLRRGIDLTLAMFDRLYAAQGGCCAICRCEIGHRSRTTHIDHCHTTGEVRGLLCQKCNHGIGIFDDDPARLRIAADYLERARIVFT